MSLKYSINVNVMNISTANILEMIAYWETLLLPLNMKECVGFRLSSFNLTLTPSKVQCQGQAHFDSELLRK